MSEIRRKLNSEGLLLYFNNEGVKHSRGNLPVSVGNPVLSSCHADLNNRQLTTAQCKQPSNRRKLKCGAHPVLISTETDKH